VATWANDGEPNSTAVPQIREARRKGLMGIPPRARDSEGVTQPNDCGPLLPAILTGISILSLPLSAKPSPPDPSCQPQVALACWKCSCGSHSSDRYFGQMTGHMRRVSSKPCITSPTLSMVFGDTSTVTLRARMASSVLARISLRLSTKTRLLNPTVEVVLHQPCIRSSTADHDSFSELPFLLQREAGRSINLSMDVLHHRLARATLHASQRPSLLAREEPTTLSNQLTAPNSPSAI